jgi:hypothetical protein
MSARAVRFKLTLDVQPPNNYYGQTVVLTKDLKTREACAASITQVPKTALALELARLDRRALATSNP